MPRRLIALLGGIAILCTPASAVARAFTVEDLLTEESLGAQAVDPSGRWLVFERRVPYDSLADYGYGTDQALALSRLWRIDLATDAPARPLLEGASGQGVTLGEPSPSGRRVAVHRLADDGLQLGILDLAAGAVRWLGLTPEVPEAGRTLQWLDDDTLLVIARPDGRLPFPMAIGKLSSLQAPGLWAASAAGGAAVTVFGSGRYAGAQPPAADRALVRVSAATGGSVELARGPFIDLEVSPDRRRVALFALGALIQPRPHEPAQGLQGISVRRHALRLLDLATREMTAPLADLDLLPNLLSWSPSGRELLVFGRDPDALWTAGRLYRLAAASGARREVGADYRAALRLRPEFVGAGWMGEDPVFLAAPSDGGRPDWRRFAADGVVNLTARLPAAPVWLQALGPEGLAGIVGGALVWVDGQGVPGLRLRDAVGLATPGRMRGSRLGNTPPARSWVRVGRRLCEVDPAGVSPGVALARLDPATDQITAQAGLALVKARTDEGVEQLRVAAPGRPGRVVAAVNGGLADVDAGEVRRVRHAGPDGSLLTSWLILPPRRPDQPPPALVVKPYLGTRWLQLPRDPGSGQAAMQSTRMLIGAGHAVLIPSLPLPQPGPGDRAPGLAARILAIVDAAAAAPETKGTFDAGRLAIWGFSFGGYTTVATIGQTDRFRAAISSAGLSDFSLQWFGLPPGYRVAPEEGPVWNWSSGSGEQGQNGMEAPPWRDPVRYARNSALLQADRITTPLLLFHGDQDGILISHAEAMFAALYRQGKDAMLVTYWGEGHLFNSPGNLRDMWRRALAFLDARLGPPSDAPAASPEPASASSGPRLPPSPAKAPPTTVRSE